MISCKSIPSALVLAMMSATFASPSQAQTEIALANAVISADLATVEQLLAVGADPDLGNPDYGQSPLEHACGEISYILDMIEFATDDNMVAERRAKIRDYRRIVEMLLDAGADPDADRLRHEGSHTGGPTPMIAGRFAPDCVAPLLAAGADPNARDIALNATVLEHGLRGGIWSSDRLVGFALILEAGADPLVTDENSDTLKWVLTETFETAVNDLSYSPGTLDVEKAEPFKFMLYAREMLDAAGVFDFGADSVLKIKSMDLLFGIGKDVGGVRGNLEDMGAVVAGFEGLTGRWAGYAGIEAPGFREEMLGETMPVRRVLRDFTGL